MSLYFSVQDYKRNIFLYFLLKENKKIFSCSVLKLKRSDTVEIQQFPLSCLDYFGKKKEKEKKKYQSHEKTEQFFEVI